MPASILSRLGLDEKQHAAAASANRAVVVTAGAGSGKTRALVGRYLHLLEQGYELRSLAAITFTDKAAREMRTRVRAEVEAWLSSEPGATHGVWDRARTELDAARISTIHSLCAEILRAHPAEAGVDPAFAVLSDAASSMLQAEAIERAFAAPAPVEDVLFDAFTQSELERMLQQLVSQPGFRSLAGGPALESWSAAVAAWLDVRLADDAWRAALDILAEHRARAPEDKLELARQSVLSHWNAVTQARSRRDWDAVLGALAALRQAATATGGRKENWPAPDLATMREAMRGVSEHYDARLAPLIGKGPEARWALDGRVAACLPALESLAERARSVYQRLKDEREALDFDDLERRAESLLATHDAARRRWQEDIRAVLVDEFQDTNERQRRIVYALAGFGEFDPRERSAPAGRLFIVGDAKQSIYRFRGADVAVFSRVQEQLAASGGQSVDLDTTYRAHHALVEVVNRLMAHILDTGADAGTQRIPFAALRAHRSAPGSPNMSGQARPPYVELHVGAGEDAPSGRRAAAEALARRLAELRRDEGFEWGHMALLFRSSTAFGVYEDAFEQAGIPFVTIAGRGFYGRPEVRDLLNALAAVADPADDLAVAGFLRSPAIGLSDAELFHLRYAEADAAPRPLAAALASQAAGSEACRRAFDILSDLRALAGRASVAQVLKRLLDLADYGALLDAAARHGLPQASRMRRNVDKLLADAHDSAMTSLSEFLDHIRALRDVGVREGEAPVEAGGSVQLMTVHKAKGLEFPVVVVADAAYEHRGAASALLFDEDLGWLPGLREDGARPVMWQLARLSQQTKEEAESRRLLYVAATRAREKLIVSGHARRLKAGRLAWHGWLGALAEVIGLSEVEVEAGLAQPRSLPVSAEWADAPIGATLYPPHEPTQRSEPVTITEQCEPAPVEPAEAAPDLVAPLPEFGAKRAAGGGGEGTTAPPARVWRVVPRSRRPDGPTWVVGLLVHQALRRWRFPEPRNAAPGAATLEAFLRPFALDVGLTDAAEVDATLREARRLLERFQAHPLCAEIGRSERRHEVPYTLPGDRGVIDVVYRAPSGWTVVDFKTDELRSEEQMWETIRREGYDRQVGRYVEALTGPLGVRPRALLVFLRAGGRVRVVDLAATPPTGPEPATRRTA